MISEIKCINPFDPKQELSANETIDIFCDLGYVFLNNDRSRTAKCSLNLVEDSEEMALTADLVPLVDSLKKECNGISDIQMYQTRSFVVIPFNCPSSSVI